MTITRTLQAALYAWNAAIRNARAEYEVHPRAACHGLDLVDRHNQPCDELAEGEDIYCRRHRAKADKRNAARRERSKR